MHPLADLLICLRFFSRLPLPSTAREAALGADGFAAAVAMSPVAGSLIGCAPAVTILACIGVGLPPMLASPLAIAVLVLVTGCLHEDGLADCADGFGGGRTRDRKLAIMRDSRIGTYGATAIALSLYLRTVAIGVVSARSPLLGAGVLVAAASVSRALCLVPLVLLRPARPDGLGRATAPRRGSVAIALALGVVIAVLLLGPAQGFTRLAAGLGAAMAGTLAVCWLAWRQIGGRTGDVSGAAQQVAEIAFTLVFAVR